MSPICSCDYNFTCHRHREPSPDLPNGDDPYNDPPEQDQPAEFVTAALAVSGNQPQ